MVCIFYTCTVNEKSRKFIQLDIERKHFKLHGPLLSNSPFLLRFIQIFYQQPVHCVMDTKTLNSIYFGG